MHRSHRTPGLVVPAAAVVALTLAGCLGAGSGSNGGSAAIDQSSPLPSSTEAQADAEATITQENADAAFEELKAAIEQDLQAMDGGN